MKIFMNHYSLFIKIKLFAITLFMAMHGAAQNEEAPQWLTDLQNLNQGFIDSTLYYPSDPEAPNTTTYVIYFHQPMKHAVPDGPSFPMRAMITVDKQMDPTTAVNHVYCTGYELDKTYVDNPDYTFKKNVNDCSEEIANRYRANFIAIEHRYFAYSAPPQCWTSLDDLRAEEAAEDFHNLFIALKKVFKGKWVMSGVSKGGITTLLQHTFHPEDMDVYVPYSAPFFDSDRDTTMQNYWYQNGWNQEYLDMFMGIRQTGVSEDMNKIYSIFYKMNCGGNTSKEHADSLYAGYLVNVALFGHDEHTYSDTASLRKQLYKNTQIMQQYGFNGYCDTVYAYMFEKCSFSLDSFGRWIDTLRAYPDPNQTPRRRLTQRRSHEPFGITEDEWWVRQNGKIISNHAYSYQSKCELGYYDFRFDLIVGEQAAPAWNATYKQYVGCLRDFENPWCKNLTFHRDLYDRTMAATQNATKPIILIYGEDDTWTGAALKDEFINGTNVKKFILPAQNHSVSFSSNTDPAQSNAIRAILDGVLGAPQDIENTPFPSGEGRGEASKLILRNGQILILRGDKTYTLTGTEVR